MAEMHLIFLTLLASVLQSPSNIRQTAPSNPEAISDVGSPNPSALQEPHVAKEYDRFQDQTTFSAITELPGAERFCGRSGELWVVHSCKGDVDACPAPYVGFNFYFLEDAQDFTRWLFRGASITLLLDGKRTPLPAPKWSSGVITAKTLRESLTAVIPLPTFQRMAAAKIIELQIGICELVLSPENLASFRAISKRISAASRPLRSPARNGKK